MSIDQKIAQLLEDSKKLQEEQIDETTEEVIELPEEFQGMSDEDLSAFMQSEEFEQLDELSKTTLLNYSIKASKNMDKHNKLSDKADQAVYSDNEEDSKVVKKFAKVKNKRGNTEFGDYDDVHDPKTYQPNARDASNYHADMAAKRKSGMAQAAKKLTKEETDYQVDVSEDVAALTNGEDLSEEFKTKAATIFEAAVVTRVKSEISKLEEQFDAQLQEEVEAIKEGLIEKVDGYLNYVVEQWMIDNELALEYGMKNEITESFIEGMKGLFEQHYIDIPEEKYDVLGQMQEQVEAVEAKLDEQLEANVELTKELNEMHRVIAIVEASAGMTDIDADKFNTLAEELAYEDSESFSAKLQTIKENYFGKKQSTIVESVVTNNPVTLTEETDVSPAMARYLRAFNGVK